MSSNGPKSLTQYNFTLCLKYWSKVGRNSLLPFCNSTVCALLSEVYTVSVLEFLVLFIHKYIFAVLYQAVFWAPGIQQ